MEKFGTISSEDKILKPQDSSSILVDDLRKRILIDNNGWSQSQTWILQVPCFIKTRVKRMRTTQLISIGVFMFLSLVIIHYHSFHLNDIPYGRIKVLQSDEISTESNEFDRISIQSKEMQIQSHKKPQLTDQSDKELVHLPHRYVPPKKYNSPISPPPSECEKSLTYVFSNCCGFASELIGLLNAMVFANDTGRPLFISQEDWNYGFWNDYFVDFPVPSCKIPLTSKKIGFQQALLPGKLEKFEKKFLNGQHIYVNRYSYHLMDKHIIEKYGKPNMNGNKFNWEFASKAQERELAKIWKPNGVIQGLINPQLRLNHKQRKYLQHGPVVGIHIRRGDKAREIEDFNAQKNDLQNYVDGVVEFTDDPRLVWIMSDDHEMVEQVSNIAQDWNVKPVLEMMYGEQKAHDQGEFNQLSRKTRIRRGQTLVAEVTILTQANYLVLTLSSNVGRLIYILRGWDKRDTIKSLDLEFFPTSVPPEVVDKMNPHAIWAAQISSRKISK